MKLKTYLKDLDASMEKFTNVAPYHAFRPIAESIEFLGKCLLGSDDVPLETDKISKICFNYAIAKLNALTKYRSYIYQPHINDRQISDTLQNTNAPVSQILIKLHQTLDVYDNSNIEVNLYTELRCGLTHAQRPGIHIDLISGHPELNFCKDPNTGLFKLDILNFYTDFHNAIEEILNSNDNSIQTFLNIDYLQM